MIAHKHRADIEPALLTWAMERAGVERIDLAKAANTSELVVEKWISGETKPTFPQVRRLAARLRMPLGFLFLSNPPSEELPIPDFRTVRGTSLREPSLDLRDAILATMRKQQWLSEYLERNSADPVDFVGQAADVSSWHALASNIRSSLDLHGQSARPSRGTDFLRLLILRVEELGVHVARNGVVGNNTSRPLDVNEFRGFCLSDSYAPFIFINAADSHSAQVFTLIHELVHIWRGDSGVSGSSLAHAPPIEAFANRVAAEVLVPGEAIVEIWSSELSPENMVERVARRFRVSRYVAAIRAFESQLVSRPKLEELLTQYDLEDRRPSASEGGDFYRTLVVRNGKTFTREVLEALRKQHVLIRDAAGLLEARPAHLKKIREAVSLGG